MGAKIYQLPVDKTGWQTADGTGTAKFTWDYDTGRQKLLTLYDKGKKKQWDANERIDWTHDPDPENPLLTPDELVPIFGSPVWDKLNDDERGNVDAMQPLREVRIVEPRLPGDAGRCEAVLQRDVDRVGRDRHGERATRERLVEVEGARHRFTIGEEDVEARQPHDA